MSTGTILTLTLMALLAACSDGGRSPSGEATRPALVILSPADGTAAAFAPRFRDIGAKVGLRVETARDAKSRLDQTPLLDRVVALLESPESFDAEDRAAFTRFVQRGGAVLLLHDALRAPSDWPWYRRLVGGEVGGEPERSEGGRLVRVADEHVLEETWTDRAFSVSNLSRRVDVVIRLRDAAGEHDRPWLWRQTYDGGRVAVFAGLGDPAGMEAAAAVEVLGEELSWLASGPPPAPDRYLPSDDYFEVETLVDGLNDPIECAIDGEGNVFILERKGAVKRWDSKANRVEVIHQLAVASRNEAGDHSLECGGLGIALDPGFAENGHVFIYHSPVEPSVNRLSRFRFDDRGLIDEVPLFDVATDRAGTTCHEGGSVQFGPGGLLFVSTGDNTNPFESDGYAPIDEREERAAFDAQRSAGNSNDLRGSILRVRPRPDGGYDVPDGNLWASGTAGARPEIFIKGCRNPYRISIDPVTGTVYWGDVGPDAGDDDEHGNPMGYDELNQARAAGYFGWPYFRGGRPYRDRDFETGSFGASFAERLENDSPRNTGLRGLPPAVDPLFAFPYASSPIVPELGDGGRNAMAGPVCRRGVNTGDLPPYFDRVLFYYDWSRAHLFVVVLDPAERFVTMHRFLRAQTFKHPIDFELGGDGALYLLEYGSTWWDNGDGRLRRVRFGGFDRRPRASFEASRLDGAVPLEVTFDAADSFDPEGRALRHQWYFGDGSTSSDPAPAHTYRTRGVYIVELEVTDAGGKVDVATATVVAGNTAPSVRLIVGAAPASAAIEPSFEWGGSLTYQVDVVDPEDGEPQSGRVTVEDSEAASPLRVVAEYLPRGVPAEPDASEPVEDPLLPGMNHRLLGTPLLRSSRCVACHHPRLPSVGPSFQRIAESYAEEDARATRARLTERVKNGGTGRYGNVPMPPQRHVGDAEIMNMIDAILAQGGAHDPRLRGANGRIEMPPLPDDVRDAFGVLVLHATYADRGDKDLPSLTGRSKAVVVPAPPVVVVVDATHGAASNAEAIAARLIGDGADKDSDCVGNWDDVATRLVWTIDVTGTASFRVSLLVSATPTEDGSTFRVTSAAQTLDGTIVATAPDGFEPIELGVLDFSAAGRHDVTLAPKTFARDRFARVAGLRFVAEPLR